jgi:D-alanyl-D-alanine carboxypeptidase
VPNGGKITIEHLLAMRSGLANYTADPDFQRRLDSEPNQVYRPEKLLSTALRQRPSFAPGEKYQYSNTNTVLLGMVIRKVTKRPVALEMQERLFKPLGLLHTFLPSSNDTRLPRPFTHGYQYGPIYEAPGKESGNKPMMRDATTWNTSWGWTAGMGISKARELAVFAQHLVGGDYLTPEWQQQRLESCLPANPDNQNPNALHYGWGIGRIGNYYGHTGELPGYNTFMVHDLASKTTIVVWTSLSEGANKRLPAIEIGSLIIAELDKSAP